MESPTLPYLGDTVGQFLARTLGALVALLGVVFVLDGGLGPGTGALVVGGVTAARPTVLTGSLKRVVEFCGLLLELG